MTKLELQKSASKLVKELITKYPLIKNDAGRDLTRIVEYKGVKYELQYNSYMDNEIFSIYKEGDDESIRLRNGQPTTKYFTKLISVANAILKGIEIQDGPILQVVENNKTIPYYSATMRLECEIDFQRIMGVVAELNEASLDADNGYMILVDEYRGQRTTMGSAFAKLSIHIDYTINDIKAILLNYELTDCHIAIQSLDYAQFDGLRDRSSQYPSHELVEKWAANKLTIK
jgi:uncharacterized protein YqgV (UPF0045/DUF77 family)